MRDDITTAEDIARILRDEVPNRVIATPLVANAIVVDTQTTMYYSTATAATKSIPSHEGKELDHELANRTSLATGRLSQAVEKGRNAARFRVAPTIKQTVKITPLTTIREEGTPA